MPLRIYLEECRFRYNVFLMGLCREPSHPLPAWEGQDSFSTPSLPLPSMGGATNFTHPLLPLPLWERVGVRAASLSTLFLPLPSMGGGRGEGDGHPHPSPPPSRGRVRKRSSKPAQRSNQRRQSKGTGPVVANRPGRASPPPRWPGTPTRPDIPVPASSRGSCCRPRPPSPETPPRRKGACRGARGSIR